MSISQVPFDKTGTWLFSLLPHLPVVKREGVIDHVNSNQREQFKTELISEILKSRPYVIDPTALDELEISFTETLPFILPLPFQSVWVEVGSSNIPLVYIGDTLVFTIFIKHNKEDNSYFVSIHYVTKDTGWRAMDFFITEENFKVTNTLPHLIHQFIFHLFNARKNLQLGVIKTAERLRVRGLGFHKIKNYLILKSKLKPIASNILGIQDENSERSIRWIKSWEVSGHWRRFEGIGKDPSGKRSVTGYTWVKPHQKGDKNENPEFRLRYIV